MMTEERYVSLLHSPETWLQRVLNIIESVRPELLDRFTGPYVYSISVIKPIGFQLNCALPFQIDNVWRTPIRAGNLTHGFLYNTHPAVVEFILRAYLRRAEVIEWAFRDFDSTYMMRQHFVVKDHAT